MTSLSLGMLMMRWKLVRTAPSRYIIYLLKHSSTDHGYLPKKTKRVLILHRDNLETETSLVCVAGLGFALKCAIVAVLSGKLSPNIIGFRIFRQSEKFFSTIIKNSGGNPQESYSTVVRVIQPEWIFLHRVTNETGYEFCRSGEPSSGDLFASSILQKIEISSIQCKNFKYNYGQETNLVIQDPVMLDDENS